MSFINFLSIFKIAQESILKKQNYLQRYHHGLKVHLPELAIDGICIILAKSLLTIRAIQHIQ